MSNIPQKPPPMVLYDSIPGKPPIPGQVTAAPSDPGPIVSARSILGDNQVASMIQKNIHQLARDGDAYGIEILLKDLTPEGKFRVVSAVDEDNLGALHYASRYNQFEALQALIRNGASVNQTGEDGLTPLHSAARYKGVKLTETQRRKRDEGGQISHREENKELTEKLARKKVSDENTIAIVQYLVTKGADINASDVWGMRPIHYAAMRGNNVLLFQLLTYAGIKIDVPDNQKMTPLHMACSSGFAGIVRVLLDAGANLRAKDEQLNTPLIQAAESGSVTVVGCILERAEALGLLNLVLSDIDYESNTALHLAVDNGNPITVKLLIDKGADVRLARKLNETPLHVACVRGNIDVVKLLVSHGANIGAVTSTGLTPLHNAASYSHIEIIDYLIDKGTYLEVKDVEGNTPLLNAAYDGETKALDRLLDRGANIEAMDRLERSCLIIAAQHNHVSTIEAILKRPLGKVLLDDTDRYSNTSLHCAAEKGYIDIVRILLEQGPHVIDAKNDEDSTPLHMAAIGGHFSVTDHILKLNKSTLMDEDENSNTPLHIAASNGHAKCVRRMIEGGADVTARNNNLWTPLDCAAAAGHAESCSVLLEHDAPLNPLDKTGTTPLHLAAKEGWTEVIKILLDWGAKPEIINNQRLNALEFSVLHGQPSAARELLKHSSWQRSMMHSRKGGGRHKEITTPMRLLIERMPEVAKFALDKCISATGHKDDNDYELSLDYTFLDDTYLVNFFHQNTIATSPEASRIIIDKMQHAFDKQGKLLGGQSYIKPYAGGDVVSKNHPLQLMVTNEREELLSHPLTVGLLQYKWKMFGRYVYYSVLLVYIIFLAFLTSYVVTTPPPFTKIMQNTTLKNDVCQEVRTLHPTLKQHTVAKIAKYALYGLVPFNLIREIFQGFAAGIKYFTIMNMYEWSLYIMTFLFIFDFDSCSEETGIRQGFQWQLGAVAIVFAWLDLILFIRKFPQFGIYVVMFTDILRTFMQFFVVLFLFLVAFGFGFYALVQNHYVFRRMDYSLVKMAVMMIGELEYDNTFNNESPDYNLKIFYPVPTYILFAVFMMIMTILVMNLLVGLAVDDIKAVQEKARLSKLIMQVDLALQVENMLPEFWKRQYVRIRQRIQPNNAFSSPWFSSFTNQISALDQKTHQKTHREIETEKMRKEQEHISSQMNQMSHKMEELQIQTKTTNILIEKVLENMLNNK